jgi:hypothetical protein
MHYIFAESWSSQVFGGFNGVIGFIWWILVIIGGWKMLVKADKPGWGIIIPFYNTYLLCKVAGRPGWWLILFFIPIVNIIIWLIVALNISENFGHGAGYGILLWLFTPIMLLVLGFGSDEYKPVRT